MTVEAIKNLISQAENTNEYDKSIVDYIELEFKSVRGVAAKQRHKKRSDIISIYIDTHPNEVVKAIKNYSNYGCLYDYFSCNRMCGDHTCLVRTIQEYFYNANCHKQRSCS